MNEEWWERPTCWICNYGWLMLVALVLALAAYFTRDLWRPLLGLQPEPDLPADLGTGDIQATLTWDSINDIDLWVTDPAGETVFFYHQSSLSGGELDVDANADCAAVVDRPVENIFWPTGGAPRGQYRVEVQYYRQCASDAPTAYQVQLLVDGKTTDYKGVLQAQGERQFIASFER